PCFDGIEVLKLRWFGHCGLLASGAIRAACRRGRDRGRARDVPCRVRMGNDGERRQVKQVRSASVRARAGGRAREHHLLPLTHAPDIVSAARLNAGALDALLAIVPYPPSAAAL